MKIILIGLWGLMSEVKAVDLPTDPQERAAHWQRLEAEIKAAQDVVAQVKAELDKAEAAANVRDQLLAKISTDVVGPKLLAADKS